MAHVRGWERIREDDRGLLWENLVLDELRTTCQPDALHYWRDKTGREVDFVVENRHGHVHAIEAKINPDAFTSDNLHAFRALYPHGRNLLVCPFVSEPYTIKRQGFTIAVCSTKHLPCDL